MVMKPHTLSMRLLARAELCKTNSQYRNLTSLKIKVQATYILNNSKLELNILWRLPPTSSFLLEITAWSRRAHQGAQAHLTAPLVGEIPHTHSINPTMCYKFTYCHLQTFPFTIPFSLLKNNQNFSTPHHINCISGKRILLKFPHQITIPSWKCCQVVFH